mmetsp:Transcript_18956/g.48867  ORF Transcript_18956/g.48867 Transcript_18956/m.48867 type:complete len:218 (+) Transcript_18956:24-677(+)
MALPTIAVALAIGAPTKPASGLARTQPALSRRALLVTPASAALCLGVAPLPVRARGCDPTSGEPCVGNYWETGQFFSKEEQMRQYAATDDAARTVIRLTARLQRCRAAFVELGPQIVLGDIGGARRALREPPLDGVRKASLELVGLQQADTKRARDKLQRFRNGLDKLDSQLLRVGRGDASADGLGPDFDAARKAFDDFLGEVGVPLAEVAPAAQRK